MGKVIVGTRPAAGASLAFHPRFETAGASAIPVGVSGPDGSFRLTTRAAGDGAPVGTYAVTLVWIDNSIPSDECLCPDPLQHDRLKGSYADPATTPLKAEIRPGNNEVFLKAEF